MKCNVNWRFAFLIFFVSLIVSSSDLFHEYIITKGVGSPNSSEAREIRFVGLVLGTGGAIVSIVGLIILMGRYGHKVIAIMYTFALFTCICLCSMVIIRSFVYLNYTDDHKKWDMTNASIDFIGINGRISKHLRTTQDRYNCCGVENVLEWQNPLMLNMKRRIPDSCCIPENRHRRCGLKALPQNLFADECDTANRECTREFENDIESRRLVGEELINLNENSTDGERENATFALKAINLDICNVSLWFNKNIYLHTSLNESGFVIVRWSAERLCYELFHRSKTQTYINYIENKNNPNISFEEFQSLNKTTYEDFLLGYLKEAGKFYVDGCFEFLRPYPEQILNTGFIYVFIMIVLFFFEIIIFYHYYWEFRVVQLADIPVPVWFESLGSGDSAPIGIGRKSIHLTENPEEIARDLHRRGVLVMDENDLREVRDKRKSMAGQPRRGRHATVRILPVENKEYPILASVTNFRQDIPPEHPYTQPDSNTTVSPGQGSSETPKEPEN